ncbi:unnamed protein product [Agarophyton chilense]|eukprot:gb/GEZJ01000248.1/.p1 GENE.gb/GEZJ01000248.1/~~gb/GEZJ01000248.1/.p1  ORF type:complete len:710 (+),score=116.65 gb/GEZJ01000248.1/:866-2995(+)
MDEVLTLKPATAIRCLQAAVRDSQNSNRASYAAKNRPEWWKENVNVKLPDDSVAKTGIFVSHSKCAWQPQQVQAALVLYYRHLHGEHHRSPSPPQHPHEHSHPPHAASPPHPPRTPIKEEQEFAHNTDAAASTAAAQHRASDVPPRASTRRQVKRAVTFNEHPIANVHHTPPPNVRGTRRRKIVLTPESSERSAPEDAVTSPPSAEAQALKTEVRVEGTQTRARPSRSQQRGKTEATATTATTAGGSAANTTSVTEATESTRTRQHNGAIAKKKNKKKNKKKMGKKRRVQMTVEMVTKPSATPTASVQDERRNAQNDECDGKTESTSLRKIQSVLPARNGPDSETDDKTQSTAFGRVKRRLDGTMSTSRSATSRSALRSLTNVADTKATQDGKRRKTARVSKTRDENDESDELDKAATEKKRKSAGGTDEGDQYASASDMEGGNETGSEDGGMTEEERKERYEGVMVAVATLEKAHSDCVAELARSGARLAEELEVEREHQANKLRQHYKMRLMHMRDAELGTRVGRMVYELHGDVGNLLVKEIAHAADSIMTGEAGVSGGGDDDKDDKDDDEDEDEDGMHDSRTRSLRRAVAVATTERKRVNRERSIATRASVRRSTRKAAQTATARTARILGALHATPTGYAQQQQQQQQESIEEREEGTGTETETETETVRAAVWDALLSEIARLRALGDGGAALETLRVRLHAAL